MKIINFEIIQILNFLHTFEDKKLPQKISYVIAKNINILNNEYSIYEKQLKKITDSYEEHFIKDQKENIEMTPSGLPRLDKKECEQEMLKEVNELLNIENEIHLCHISEDCFDYSDADGRYETLSVKELLNLQNILCKKEK